jgi:class 3 adenylate cyclase
VAPAIASDADWVVLLQSRVLPIRRHELGRPRGARARGDTAALDSMAVQLILPVHRDDDLAAFVCLGAKRSGDSYTASDLALLQTISDKASDRLGHFQREDVYRQEREMYEELRKYVPGVIADRVQEGASLEPRAAEVTVLFVDIRGFVSFSESRSADTIFSAINQYTRVVSGIVRANGGSVVEFNGDGMMVVFGAPDALKEKELAAVTSARSIHQRLQGMEIDPRSRLDVGVGIATGEAFVGSVQAVDRKIWSALGNTTNLAARLQKLTRDVDAAVVIDAPTWLGAGKPKDFARLGPTPIRGRRFPIDVFALRLEPGGADSSQEDPS